MIVSFWICFSIVRRSWKYTKCIASSNVAVSYKLLAISIIIDNNTNNNNDKKKVFINLAKM